MKWSKCQNCESPLYGKFCSNCGQKSYSEKDKSLSSLSHEAFHFLTHFDGKIFHTIKTIFKYPGKLTLDYCSGVRQRYYKPVSFYLLIILLYLLFPVASGMNMEMKYHKNNLFIGDYVARQIEEKSVAYNITEEEIAERFHHKSKSTSKFVLLLLIPLSAPILYFLYYRRKRYLYDNFILLTEINIFFLLTFFILIPTALLPFLYYFDITFSDRYYGPFIIVLFCIYCSVLFKKVFQERWWLSILKGAIFGFLFLFVVNTIYKAIVFMTTFALIL